MTTLVPREPYTDAELTTLYPASLQLEQVQILLRHGERSPVSARFKNAGVPQYWPYCNAAQQLRSALITPNDSWDHITFRRMLETFDGKDDSVSFATGPKGETAGICLPGELTDIGRRTTASLGSRLRHLYIDRLHFLPATLSAGTLSQLYLRATPIPRALESVQQTYNGFYPPHNRTVDLPIPEISTRQSSDETLFPNEGACKRLGQLVEAFGDRAASIWNDSPELKYVNSKIGKWMPPDSPAVKVDSHPRLSGVMDTINSTRAHGPESKLPNEFYDEKAIANIERIGVQEWFDGYKQSLEYRRLGIGSLVGDITARLVERARAARTVPVKGNTVASGKDIRFALSGCHDTTLAAILASLGAYNEDKWPPYTSHIAVELFRSHAATVPKPSSYWAQLWPSRASAPSSRTPLSELSPSQRADLEGFYVRLRFNDRVMTIPGCGAKGNHYGEDESMCTLEAFKGIVDKFTPRDWKKECVANLGAKGIPDEVQRAGY